MQIRNTSKNWINVTLIFLVAINIIGDVGNISFWFSSPDSQTSLKGGYIARVVGSANAVTTGAAILAVVALIYVVALLGLVKKKTWAPLLVILVSVANRAIAAFLYKFSEAFYFWFAWTIILLIVASLDYLKLTEPKQPLPTPTQTSSTAG